MGNLIKFPVQFIPTERTIDKEDPKDILPQEAVVWKCGCSSHLFFLTPEGAMCSNCGIMAQWWCDGVDG